MNNKVTVIKQGSSSKPVYSQCPWIMDVPPEANGKQ